MNLMNLRFSSEEILLLSDICSIQISSYSIILEGKVLVEDELLLSQFGDALEMVKREARWRISQYKELQNNPLYLGIMEDSEISTMRHVLFHMEETYITRGLTEPVRALWEKFFTIEEYRNNMLKIKMVNVKRYNGNEKTNG